MSGLAVRRVSLIELSKRLHEVGSCKRLTAEWFSLSLGYLRATKLSYPCEVHFRSGDILRLQELTDLIIFWLVFVRRYYPVDPADKIIVDVGANIGAFTLYAARTAPSAKIYAVEPFPDTCLRLRETIRANNLEDRVTVVECAITGSHGTTLMDVSAGVPSQYRSVLSEIPKMLNQRHKNYAVPQGGVSVPTVTLAEFLAEQNLDNLDLLKMNIHGNEYEVLLSSPSSALSRLRRIAVQYHDVPKKVGLDKWDLFRKLQRAGFRLVADSDTKRGAGRAILASPYLQHA